MVQRIRVGISFLLYGMVYEQMRHKFQKVEIILSLVLGIIFQIFIYFTVFFEHIENSVGSVINRSKELFDIRVLRLMSKS